MGTPEHTLSSDALQECIQLGDSLEYSGRGCISLRALNINGYSIYYFNTYPILYSPWSGDVILLTLGRKDSFLPIRTRHLLFLTTTVPFWKVNFALLHSLLFMEPALKAQSLKLNGGKSDLYSLSFPRNTLRIYKFTINVKEEKKKEILP